MTRPVEARVRPSYSRRIMSRAGFLLASSFLGLVLAAPGAFAQDGLYPGSNVSVGPAVGGARVLLYPGGKYERIQPHLLQPGGPYPGSAQPIHLHMPGKHATRREAAQEPAQTRTESAPQIARTQPKREAPVKQTQVKQAAIEQATQKQVEATPEPAPQQPAPQPAVASTSAAPIPFSFDGRSNTPVMDQAAAQASTRASTQASTQADTKAATKAATPKKAAPEKQTVASLPPAPQSTPVPQPEQEAAQKTAKKSKAERDLTKRSQILFPHDATEPARVAAAKLTALAGDLSNALDAGADRVQLDAYGGKPGDKSSDARRISLKRALTIRQILIDNGVPSSRIDVRAMGGVDDNGPHDRVDVYTRG